MRVTEIWVHHNSQTTIFYEGADPMTDYCPLTSRVSQKWAIRALTEYGKAPGCYVTTTNSRDPGEPRTPAQVKAARFAAKVGLPFREAVYFPPRASYEEATADALKEPTIATEVEPAGRNWVGDHLVDQTYQARRV